MAAMTGFESLYFGRIWLLLVLAVFPPGSSQRDSIRVLKTAMFASTAFKHKEPPLTPWNLAHGRTRFLPPPLPRSPHTVSLGAAGPTVSFVGNPGVLSGLDPGKCCFAGDATHCRSGHTQVLLPRSVFVTWK